MAFVRGLARVLRVNYVYSVSHRHCKHRYVHTVGAVTIVESGTNLDFPTATFRPNPVINICYSIVGNFVFWVWVPPLLLEFVLFALTVAKAFQQNRRVISNMPIAYVLYRDGALYFIVITRKSLWPYYPPSTV